jgi:NAD(P)-dependent dehydrogenase (short-subunit alcohol dehydrogenase family)
LGGKAFSVDIKGKPDYLCDITKADDVNHLAQCVHNCDILVNNAVGNQKPVSDLGAGWATDIDVGLTGALRMIGAFSTQLRGSHGVILNMGSDLSLIGPDPHLYERGSMKPVSYSVVKHGMVGLTRYFAALFGPSVRVNCLCPGGIEQGQKVPYVPLGRLAKLPEMKGAVAFLLSDASSYMTGSILAIDGGRTAW